jgi:4-amino-4-deoxy-L-arabinose transferase-like glycosyltransferase
VAIILLFLVSVEFAILLVTRSAGLGARPLGDEIGYHQLAVNLMDRGRFSAEQSGQLTPNLVRTPGYPVFLVAVYWLAGRSFLPVLIGQLLLLAAAGTALFIFARRWVAPKAAAAAAVLTVTSPQLIFMATYRLTEILSVLLAILFVFALTECLVQSKHRMMLAGLAGFLLGLGVFVRPGFLLIAGLSVLIMLLHARNIGLRPAMRLAASFSLGVLLFLLPWMVRNYRLTQQWIPLANVSGWSMYQSALQYTRRCQCEFTGEDWKFIIEENNARHATAGSHAPAKNDWERLRAENAVDESYARDAKAMVFATPFSQVLGRIPCRLQAFWNPGYTFIRRFHRIAGAHHVLAMLLAAVGIFLMRNRLLRQWPLWLVPLYLTALHMVFHIEPRYSYPARPFLFVYAGLAAHWVAERGWARLGRRRLGVMS